MGNAPAVRVRTVNTGRFGSSLVHKPDQLTLGVPNPDPYPSTRGFCGGWPDPSVPISGSVFRVSHVWSHSDMLLLVVKSQHWYVTAYYQCFGRLNGQNERTAKPYHILKMSVN